MHTHAYTHRDICTHILQIICIAHLQIIFTLGESCLDDSENVLDDGNQSDGTNNTQPPYIPKVCVCVCEENCG